MRKIVVCTAVIATFCLLLSGCGSKDVSRASDDNLPNAAAATEKVVVNIAVETKTGENSSTKSYSDSEKIGEICDFIRRLTWKDLQDEIPEEENGTEYAVTYMHEDNTAKVYHFKENNYFKTDTFDWKVIGNLGDFKQLIAD